MDFYATFNKKKDDQGKNVFETIGGYLRLYRNKFKILLATSIYVFKQEKKSELLFILTPTL